jgi:glycosyltransferase involved in cell wall biosynthesis
MSCKGELTIGIPVFNGARLLAGALNSIIGQDIDNFEVIVCDNASTDDTVDIVADFMHRDSRIRLVRNQVNIGLIGNFNRTFALSRSKYFKWATHDDFLAPNFLSTCLHALDRRPDAVLSSTAVVIQNADGRELARWSADPGLESADPAQRTATLIRTLKETHLLFGVIRSEALRRAGPLENYLVTDRVLLTRLSLLGQFCMSPQYLYHYTFHRPAGRTYSVYNDPAAMGRVQMRTWRAIGEHLKVAWSSDLRPSQKVVVSAAVMDRFALRDARRLTAEVYLAGRSAIRRR